MALITGGGGRCVCVGGGGGGGGGNIRFHQEISKFIPDYFQNPPYPQK